MIRVILIFSIMLVFAITAYTNVIDRCQSDWGVSCSGMRISICPQGDFEFIRDGCGTGNDYIWIHVVDINGNGIQGIPCSDYWLMECDPSEQLCLCINPVVADSLTNSEGCTTISGRISGGGCVTTGGLCLVVQGGIIFTWPACTDPTCHSIIVLSPDLNTDCKVNLLDLAIFGVSYNKLSGDQNYNTCCDYNDDGMCNLVDLAYFASHYQHECP